MAIKNSVAIAMTDGIDIPAGNVIVTTTYVRSIPQYDSENNYTGVSRIITYDLFPYKTEADVTAHGVSYVLGGMIDVPSGWSKEMTEQEYADLLNQGELAEVWLKDQLNIWLKGNNASIVNPY